MTNPPPPDARTPSSGQSAGAPADWPLPPPPARPRATGARIADVTVSVLLMVAGVIGFGMLAMLSLLLVMASDGCYDDQCNSDLMMIGWGIAMLAPPAVFIGAIVWTIIRIAIRKTSWWVPLVGAGVAGAAWGLGVGLMEVSLGR